MPVTVLPAPSLSRISRNPGGCGDPHLSYSQVRAFSTCPLQWSLAREYAPAFAPVSLVFGAAFHAGINAFYQARLEGRAAELEELLGAFIDFWTRETTGKGLPVKFTAKLEDEDVVRELACRMFSTYLAEAPMGEVVAGEEPFVVKIDPDLPPIAGRIDLVEIRAARDGPRHLYLVDLKTAARRPTPEDLDYDKLALYALAARDKGWTESLGLPVTTEFRSVTKTKSPTVATDPVDVTRHDIDRFTEKLRQCWQSMQAGIGYPASSWRCSSCGQSALCQAWPHLPAVAAAPHQSLPAA